MLTIISWCGLIEQCAHEKEVIEKSHRISEAESDEVYVIVIK